MWECASIPPKWRLFLFPCLVADVGCKQELAVPWRVSLPPLPPPASMRTIPATGLYGQVGQCPPGGARTILGRRWPKPQNARNMVQELRVPRDNPMPAWTQDPAGWWWVNGTRVLHVDLKAGIVSIAADCPWQVDIDYHWLESLANFDDKHTQSPAPAASPVDVGIRL